MSQGRVLQKGAGGRHGASGMAYVPDYDHDVFVSYAHLDDQGESAWVTNLVRHLDTEVRQRLGTKDLRIWIDHSSTATVRSPRRSCRMLFTASMASRL